MLIFVGAFIVFAATIGGFMMAGGHPGVLLHASEFVVILGIALGVLVIATPTHVMKEIIHKMKDAMFGKTAGKPEFFDILKLLYELFMTGRRNGLIALEEHVMDPTQSALFKRYPSVLNHPERRKFIVNGLKPVIDGKIKPDQLEDLMAAELKAKEVEMDHPVHAMQMIGDSLPAIGIVAAVLGIINTMSAIEGSSNAEIGMKVGAALTGTFLGILVAYGFVGPIAAAMEGRAHEEGKAFEVVKMALVASVRGYPPQVAVEFARKLLFSDVRPTFTDLETHLKGKPKAAAE
jgi:chemotaxis protein MotA